MPCAIAELFEGPATTERERGPSVQSAGGNGASHAAAELFEGPPMTDRRTGTQLQLRSDQTTGGSGGELQTGGDTPTGTGEVMSTEMMSEGE